jgi:membrane protease YdiL (CAAX protease family)
MQAVPATGQAGARALLLGSFYIVQLVALTALSRRHRMTLFQAFGLGRVGRTWAHRAGSVALVVGLLIATRLAGLAWGALSQAVGWHPPAKEQLTTIFGPRGTGLLLATVMVVLVAPFVEELLFRGVVMTAAAERWGMWPGIVISAGLFSAIHVTAWAIVPTFALGVALGWLAWTRGSLWPAIVLHALYTGSLSAAFWLVREPCTLSGTQEASRFSGIM